MQFGNRFCLLVWDGHRIEVTRPHVQLAKAEANLENVTETLNKLSASGWKLTHFSVSRGTHTYVMQKDSAPTNANTTVADRSSCIITDSLISSLSSEAEAEADKKDKKKDKKKKKKK